MNHHEKTTSPFEYQFRPVAVKAPVHLLRSAHRRARAMSLEEWLRVYECSTGNEKIVMRDFSWGLKLPLRLSLSPPYPQKNDIQDEYVSHYGKELSQYAFKKKIEEDIGPMLTLKLKG